MYRRVALGAEQCQIEFNGNVLFAAKPATNHGTQNTDLVVRHAECVSDETEMFDDLGRHTDVNNSVFVDPCQADFGLQKCMLNELGFECIFDDVVGLGETFFNITFPDLVLSYNIVRFRNRTYLLSKLIYAVSLCITVWNRMGRTGPLNYAI